LSAPMLARGSSAARSEGRSARLLLRECHDVVDASELRIESDRFLRKPGHLVAVDGDLRRLARRAEKEATTLRAKPGLDRAYGLEVLGPITDGLRRRDFAVDSILELLDSMVRQEDVTDATRRCDVRERVATRTPNEHGPILPALSTNRDREVSALADQYGQHI